MNELEKAMSGTDIDKINLLTSSCIAIATGEDKDGSSKTAYKEIRRYFINNPEIKENLPDFVRKCGDGAQFWGYIKAEDGTYAGRRNIIWSAFQPLTDYLENRSVSINNDTPDVPQFYSVRTGINKNTHGFPLGEINGLFLKIYTELHRDGYFDEYLGSSCIDVGDIPGKISDPETDMYLKLRKKLWPIYRTWNSYSEDDLFDVIEYLFTVVSKPLTGKLHDYNECGMHWETFSKKEGEKFFREKINYLLSMYQEPFELSATGQILRKAEDGFDPIFKAEVPSDNSNIKSRVDAAILKYRRHGSTLDDRRQAVRDLADVLEYIRPELKKIMDKKDESELFNILNNFGVRHHNDIQKNDYDPLWLNWMFYFFLSTIHVALRKIKPPS